MTIKKITKRKTDISIVKPYQLSIIMGLCLYEYAIEISEDKNCLSLWFKGLKEIEQILKKSPQYKQELKRNADGKLKSKRRKSRTRAS